MPRPPAEEWCRCFDLPPQLGLGLLVTILKPPSPLPARLDEPERLPLKVPIDVRGTARLVPLPFAKLPRFIMAAFRSGSLGNRLDRTSQHPRPIATNK
jgi:hypothetical protein